MDDMDEALMLTRRDFEAHNAFEKLICKLKAHKNTDGMVKSHRYTGANEKQTIRYESPYICDLCGSPLPRRCESCGRTWKYENSLRIFVAVVWFLCIMILTILFIEYLT